jgi:hypothetical protein
MSTLSEALAAIKSIILIEERVKAQSEKLERLAQLVVDVDRWLIRVETTLDLAMRRSGQAEAPLPISRRRSARDPAED